MLSVIPLSVAAALALTPNGQATPIPGRDNGVVRPSLKSSDLLGITVDRTLQRDSCGSVRWGDRLLWVCRDTEFLINNDISALIYNSSLRGFATSTASYSDFNANGSPKLVGCDPRDPYYPYSQELTQYGYNNNETSFYPLQDDECNDNGAGNCGDGTRFAIWPNTPPTITSQTGGQITAYTFIRNEHITNTLGVVTPDPTTSLYRLDSVATEDDTLPTVSLVNEFFWAQDQYAFGDYGTVVRDNWAYLYAEASNGNIALAKAPLTSIEDQSSYQFYVNGDWGNTPPTSVNDSSAALEHPGAGGQGTYFWSDPWQTFVWLGQPYQTVAPELWVSTAPAPEGPWIEPYKVLDVPPGNYTLPAYSFQIHNGLSSDASSTDLYMTYTKNDGYGPDNFAIYSQPLYLLKWN